MCFKLLSRTRLLSLLVRRRCLQWCLMEGVAEGPDCGFRGWAPPHHPPSHLLVIWDPAAVQEPGALRAGRGQGLWSCGSTSGFTNVSMAPCPGQLLAPLAPGPLLRCHRGVPGQRQHLPVW